ncbi:MAG: PAS domain S-box protein [Desulforhopalus sp.]
MLTAQPDKESQKRIQELERTCTEQTQSIEILKQYRDVISSTLDGVALLDKDYRYVFVNKTYERFSGVKKEELIGQTVFDYLGRDFFEHYVKPNFDRCMAGETVNYQEWVDYPTLGTRFVDVTYFPSRDNNQNITGVIATTRDITERKYSESEQRITIDLLQVLHKENDRHNLARSVLKLMQEWSGCEAVGIRLQDGDDYPYLETRGFPAQFIRAETQLFTAGRQGAVAGDCNRDPELECMCGSVIRGRFSPDLPFFTQAGSFWTNSTSELLAILAGTDHPLHIRGHCNAAGYESVALIALQSGQQRIGLLQFNDKQKGRFDDRIIALLERLASSLALGFLQRNTAMVLRESEEKYKGLVNNLPGTAFQFKMTVHGEQSFTFIGGNVSQLIGLTPEEVVADSARLLDRIPQPDTDAVQQAIAQSAATLLPYDVEHRIIHKNGRTIWLRSVSTPRKSHNSDTIWDGIALDITKRKEAEAELLQSYEDIRLRERIAKHFLTSSHNDLFNDVLNLLLTRFTTGYGHICNVDVNDDLSCSSLTQSLLTEDRISQKSVTFARSNWTGIWSESLEQGVTILCNNQLTTPDNGARLDNALVVPLLVDKHLIGQIALADKRDGFTSEDRRQFESFAEFIAPVFKIYLEKEEMDTKLRSSVLKLKQTNIALNVMIDKSKDEKKEFSSTIRENFDKLVFPYFETVRKNHSKEEILTILDIVKQNTKTSLLSLGTPPPSRLLNFSPKEIQVAHLIKAGKSSKEIASVLHISLRSVFFHRNNIRKKLNIHKKKENLSTILHHLDL